MKASLLLLMLVICLSSFSQSLPDFSFTTVEGTQLNKAALKPNTPVIVFYFDPYCEVCIQQAATIKKAMDKLANATMVWVSWAEMEDLKIFKDTHLPKAKNIIVTKDANFMFDGLFGYSEVPAIFVYNASWSLTAKFSKETSVEDLVKAIK